MSRYTDEKADKNCHEYCPYSRRCRYEKGEIGKVVDECSMYYKLEDIASDARDIADEQRRVMGCDEDEW